MVNFIMCFEESTKPYKVCGSGSVVERCLAKANVASSNLVFRSKKFDNLLLKIVEFFIQDLKIWYVIAPQVRM